MLGGLLFVVCVILQFHYHDAIPWYIWLLAFIAQCWVFDDLIGTGVDGCYEQPLRSLTNGAGDDRPDWKLTADR